jgi:hypothetical protein
MRQQICVASVNCLELPADGHFAWDVRWQGLKPNLLQVRFTARLKSCLIQNRVFSAACKAVERQTIYGTAEAVPFV